MEFPEDQNRYLGTLLNPVSRRSLNFGRSRNRYCTGDRLIPRRDPEGWAERIHYGKSEVCKRKPARLRLLEDDDDSDKMIYRAVLDNELLNTKIDNINEIGLSTPKARPRSIYDFSPAPPDVRYCPYSFSPLSPSSISLLRTPVKQTRKIHRVPYKILDAPELQDDFYLNLVDWSKKNVLAVGLGASVYLWNASTSQVTRLFDLGDNDSVTAVNWSNNGDTIAVGTDDGTCQLWDAAAQKQIGSWLGHSSRVGCIAWNNNLVCSGSRDRTIYARDVRTGHIGRGSSARRFKGHDQEVCGLKWSPDFACLASGGNDNRLIVWSMRCSRPVQLFDKHTAAVKALDWSPRRHGLLASGGGAADRCLKVWNTLTGQLVKSMDTGSQVCNMLWSMHSSELVTTHGYSQNQVVVWRYPQLEPIAKLLGHSSRVLYLAMSPDGESIVTGAGDETLRFWRVFTKEKENPESKRLALFESIYRQLF